MNFNKLTISDLVGQQLPNFIVDEFPTYVKFFEEYYKSLEVSGGILDIQNNFLEYTNVDSLRKFNLVKTYKLQTAIDASATSIVLDKIDGLRTDGGIIGIGDEIILYSSVDIATRTLTDCERGFSATTKFDAQKTTIETSTAQSHDVDDVVTNYSSLILFFILKNYEKQYLAGFPHENIADQIGKDTLIRNIKDFYSYKGTDLSIEFLFRALYDEEVTVRYPRDRVIKASYSDWTVDDIIKVEQIEGNPYDLVGSQIRQTDATGVVQATAIIDDLLINNISNYSSGTKNIYEVRLNVLNSQVFTIPQSSILRRDISASDSVITVDSTLSFPKLNGVIEIDGEFITYRTKTFNQFIDCGRGAYGTNPAPHFVDQEVVTTEYLFGYPAGKSEEEDQVKMRILGVLSEVDIRDGSNYFETGEKIKLSPDGDTDNRPQFTSWRLNEVGNFCSSSDIQINNAVKNIPTSAFAVFKDSKYAYVTSAGLPANSIGPFRGVGYDVRNQNILKSIPLTTEKNTQKQETKNKPVGLFINGVEAFSAQDYEEVSYGSIDSVSIAQSGFGFEENIQPIFRVKDATGNGATFNASIVDGKVTSISVIDGGQDYTRDHELEVTYGFDATATIAQDAHLVNGEIKTITVTGGGQDYVATPNVEIVDTAGRGKGAFAIAQVTNNQVTGVVVLNGGTDYTDKSTIQVRIVSKGTGIFATANVKKWSFDRVFKTKNTLDANQNWIPATQVKSDLGNGYLYASSNAAYGLQYGFAQNPKLLRSSLVDNVQGVNAAYAEKTSGFVHSPILGWAYDGNPIYGPYGYSNPVDSNSAISRQTSSYALKSTAPSGRPSTAKYPLGAFIQDYDYIQGNGSLDFNNGRFCKTPEFPNGRYCYFITVDNFGSGVYPYILGKTFYSVPAANNFNLEFDQSNDSNIPEGARRIRTANTPTRGFDASLIVGEIGRGAVDSFTVTESGATFKNSDYLYIDNTDTEGSRLFGRVSQVDGKTVPRVSYQVASGSTIPATNGIPNAPWPVEISAPEYADTKFAVTAETSEPHGLSSGDEVTLSLALSNVNITKTFKVRVSNYQTITYNKPSVTTKLVVDVAFNAVNISINTPDALLLRENDYIKINDEILKITSINTNSGLLAVDRGQFNTPLRLHAATNPVTLHIPDDQPDYRLTVGSPITTTGVAGVIYNINKENSTIDVRVTSGTFASSNTIVDTSSPTGRDLDIASVSEKSVYWEIDPTGTGNHYVRDLQFRFIRGSKYIFDLSDGSNLNHNLIFSEDSANVNTLSNVSYIGTPGTPGASATIEKASLMNMDVSRVYYYDEAGGIINNKKYFSLQLLPAGTQKIDIVDSTKFQFSAPFQPEVTEWLNLISYKTTSQTAIGKISEIVVIDGGEGYKKLPKIEGVTHTLLDDIRTEISLVGGSFSEVKVINGGSRYSSSTKIFVNTTTGSGAVLTPTVVGGKIISIKVDDPGDGYSADDTITAVDTDAKIYAQGENIGKIKTVRFSNNGSQFTSDRTLSKSLLFNKKVIVRDLPSDNYKLAEVVTTTGGFEGEVESITALGNDVYLLDLLVIKGELNKGDTLVGQINQYTSVVEYATTPDVVGKVGGYVGKVGFFESDLGKISSSSQKITDSNYFQDFSYVIRSTRSLSEYKQYVDETTHPLGFKLFGEVAVENDVDFEDTVTGNPFSIGLAEDPHAREVIISLPDINVESDIVFKKHEVSVIKAADIKSYIGQGAARLNFLENQIEATKIADISSSFDDVTKTFTLTTQDGNFPKDAPNTSVMVALNEIFQEPYETQDILGITYDGGLMTVTTDGDHGYAVTTSGQTYPDQKYVHISGVINSVANINFNDKFEIYDVPSSDTFRATINNPNGVLTNNDPAVCADVKSTIDNLTTILTYYTANPSASRPIKNQGIWPDPTQGPVSANRHRDGANLISANRFHIIDRANAEISLQYPDFYYPNDPQTNSYSRYRDAYRLIMTNRKELVDRGAAQIAVDYPDFVYPGDPTTASDYRFKDAYRLIQQNRQEIIDNAWTTMQAGSNTADPAVETKCKRDIGLFIDYTSLDLVNGGNEYARKFALQYFDENGNPLTNGLLGEELASNDAFNAAKDNMILAFTNQLTVTDSTITPDPAGAPLCANVTSAITTLTGIVTAAIAAGSTAGLPTETIGADRTGEAKCKRDIGLFVDAMALDVHTGGNVYARKFLKQYFNAAGTSFTTNGLDGEILQSITAFEKVRDLMKLAIVNQLLEKDLTITSANANYWGTAVGTPTNVTYDAVTGVAQVTIANHGLNNGDDVLIKSNGLTFTCAMDGNVAEKSYPRLADGNHETAMAVSNATNDTFDITVGASPEKTFTISDADYDPVSGDVELTIGNHSLRAGTGVKIEPESITFTCNLDNDATEHSYPKSEILNATVDNAVYNPSSGVLTVTVEKHGWENGDFIKFDDNSLKFTCARDNNQTEHTYPRSTDPVSGKWIPIYDVYYDSFKVKIGVSSDTSEHTFVSAVDDGLKKKKDKTFDTSVPIISTTATTIKINVGSSTDTSVHTYVPRLYTVTDATYDPTSGILGITSANHGFTAGDGILLGDGSLTFSCTCDGNVEEISYPRSTDPASKKRLNVISATNDQLTVNIGASPLVKYTPTNATYDGSTGLMEVTIGNHGINPNTTVKMLANGITFSCGAATGTHTFVSGVTNAITAGSGGSGTFTAATGTTYDPSTGDLVLEIGSHSLTTANSVTIADGGVTFTCDADNHGSNHSYPRPTDPASGLTLSISATTATTITVNVGAAAPSGTNHSYPRTLIDSFTVTGATYTASTGAMTVTVNDHGMINGDWIKFEDDSLTFTCDQDSHNSNHTYPRSTDPVSGKFIQISNVTQNTFDVNVGESPAGQQYTHLFVSAVADGLKHKRDRSYDQPIPVVSVTDTTITLQVGTTSIVSAHTFVSALTDAIISGGEYPHTFVSAASGALNQAVVISGGNYSHTFIRAVEDAIVRPVVNSPVANNSNGACADVQSNIDNLVSIVTTYLSQGSLVSPLPLPIESMRVPSFGEGKCKRDLGIIVDAIIADMRSGGNSNILEATERYIDGTALLTNGIAGELAESTTAFNKARDMAKLAITNQLYEKDFTILPDFLTTSGTLDSTDVTDALLTEGQFEYENIDIKFYETPKEGTTFYSTFFKFVDGADNARYSYKIKDILFDGTSKRYDLKRKNGSNIVTEQDENLLIFIDGVLQIYGEAYTIDRTVNPNQIVFTTPIEKERHFFGYTFSKYKMLNNFSHLINGSRKSFEFAFGDDNIIPPDVHQILVLLDGVPQTEGIAYNIVDNVITFTEAPQVDKNCHCLYFYGKTFEKTISIWNGNIFENLEFLGNYNPDGCKYQNKVANTGDIVHPGDLIKIDGETPKEIIRMDQRALENTDNLLYTAYVYTDNSYIRGKNAVASATVTGVPVSGSNTIGVENTIGVDNTMGIPTVYDYQVTGATITNSGLEYDVAPIVLFKTTCDNPGTGAKGYAEITNGKVTNVVITDGGSGYNAAPEIIFAKKYEIVRPHTPLFTKKNTILNMKVEGGNAGVVDIHEDTTLEDLLPLVVSQISAERTTHVQTLLHNAGRTNEPGLAYNLNTFDQIKFQFEPSEFNDPLANYIGTGVTIEHMTRYAPNITIGDFTTHAGVAYGSAGGVIINIPADAYVTYGLTLNGAINDAVTTVTVTGDVSNFPPAGYLEFGDEIMEYTSISGQDFTVVRGVKSTTATTHADGDYLRLAWRG
jgi:hypothetical protein|tara:strand:+ start:10389 stop:21593 length:11205 start_codon:yes stop_codon:yes gene_type:complete